MGLNISVSCAPTVVFGEGVCRKFDCGGVISPLRKVWALVDGLDGV